MGSNSGFGNKMSRDMMVIITMIIIIFKMSRDEMMMVPLSSQLLDMNTD